MTEIGNIQYGGETYPLKDEAMRAVVGDVGMVLGEILESANPVFGAKLDEINGEVI